MPSVLTFARKWLRLKVPSRVATPVEWLRARERTEIVLCEMEPSVTVRGFDAVGGGAPNVYAVSLPRFFHADILNGGIYRSCIGVTQDDVDLAGETSVAACDAHAGSWYWDEANGVLYVHTTSGADPDLFTLIQATVRLTFSNQPVVLRGDDTDHATGRYYLPWMTGDLPVLRRKTEDLLSGATEVPEGNVSFTNGHGAWWTLVANDGMWNWKNKKIRFLIGGSYAGLTMTRSQYIEVGTMIIEDHAPNEEVCVFFLQPIRRFAEIELPVTPYFEGEYPHLGEGVRGTKKWIGYGRATIPPDLTDTTSHGVYTVADAAFQTLTAVHNVWAIEKATGIRTLLALSTHYTVDLVACTVTIVSASFPHTTHTIAVDVTGKAMHTYPAIVRDLLTEHLGVAAADIDEAAFDQAEIDADMEISLWLKSPRQLTSILATAEADFPSLGRTSMGTLQETVDGKWTVRIFNLDRTGTETEMLRSDFAEFKPAPKLKRVYATVRVHYNFDHSKQEWDAEEATNHAVTYATKSREPLDLYTYLRNASDAQTLAQRYLLLAGAITVEADFIETGALLAAHQAGEKVRITYTPAPTAVGTYQRSLFEVLSLNIALGPKLHVSGVLGNLRGLGGRIGHWGDDDAPDWADASVDERQSTGFWSDTDGYIDPDDQASRNQSIWW